MRPRPAALLALPVLACLATTGCSREEAPPVANSGEPVRGGTAVLGSISDVDNWNPYLSGESFAHMILRRIYLPLASENGVLDDGTPRFEPELAGSWSFSEDRLELTFELRPVSWSDGRPVTSTDVVFTWQAQTSPEVPWAGVDTKRAITEVRADGDRRVVFRFARTYPDQLADAVEGMILPAHAFGVVPFDGWVKHDWSTVGVGSGPFVLERHRVAEEIALTRNPSYFREDLPRLDRVVVRVVPDSANLLVQLLAGDLDYVDGVDPRDAGRLESDAEVRLVRYMRRGMDFIGWNGRRPPLDDPQVRRALTQAIDREALVEDVLYGFGRVSAGPLPSVWWGTDRNLAPFPADRAAAVALLAERGFEPGPDGVLARDGEPLELTLLTNAGNRTREAMLVKIQEQLSRIGVRVEFRTLRMDALIESMKPDGFDGILLGLVFSGKVDIGQLVRSSGQRNFVYYASDDVDRLVTEIESATTHAEMLAPLAEVQRLVHEHQPYTFLYEMPRLIGARRRLRDVSVSDPSDPLARLEHYWVDPR